MFNRRDFTSLALAAPLLGFASPAKADSFSITAQVRGLDTPFGLAFLPEGGLLITERNDGLRFVGPTGKKQRVRGLPKSDTRGQGGYMDVMVPRDFSRSRHVYLTYSKNLAGGAGTALMLGKLAADGTRLENPVTLFEMSTGSGSTRHFGSRVLEAPDGHLFLCTGDRGADETAQDLGLHNGKVLRLRKDGAPAGHRFDDADALPEIWSYGHRNPQGAAFDASGTLWVVEHGAKGGDEINLIEAGGNYGWPVISYGRHYSGGKIGEGTSKAGMKQPKHYWDPSIAPSGMMIYSGKLWPQWRGHMFVGSLKFNYISILSGKNLTETGRIDNGNTKRVRDVREAPDGSIWFLSEGNSAAFRIEPS